MLGSGASSRRVAGLAAAVTALAMLPLVTVSPAVAATKPAAVRVVVTATPSTVTATGTTKHPVDRVVVRGHVTPASGRVVLQRASGKRWVDLTGVRIGKTGSFVLVGQGIPVGRETLRVVRAAAGKVKAVASRSFVVTVRGPHLAAQPVPPVTPPAPSSAPAPPAPAAPPADPPVTPTCRAAAAGYPSPLSVSITEVLGYVGQAWGSAIIVDNEDSPWTATVEGALPPGITQRPGGFGGTPQAAGVFRFTLLVTDQAGGSLTLPVCFQFVPPLRLLTSSMPPAEVGQPYDEPLPLAGGFLPLTLDEVWQPVLGADGFSLGATEDLRGTPTVAGAKTLSFRFVDPTRSQVDVAVTVPIGPLPANPRTWLVPGDAATIQGGIDLARPGDTVLVGPGTYRESLDFDGKDIAVRSSAGPDSTVVQGDGTHPVVAFSHAESRDAVIDGFTLRGGVGRDTGWMGGGVDIYFSSPTVEHNVIVDNNADYGGGVGIFAGSPAIVDNRIAGNSAQSYGGGLFMSGTAAAVVRGNLIEGNNFPRYGFDGGGADISGQDLLFQDNVLEGNAIGGSSSGEGAAGLLIEPSDGMRVVDDVVADNVGFEGVTISGYALPVLDRQRSHDRGQRRNGLVLRRGLRPRHSPGHRCLRQSGTSRVWRHRRTRDDRACVVRPRRHSGRGRPRRLRHVARRCR